VKQRTAELDAKVIELQQMNQLMIGRELKMKEMKEKITVFENSLVKSN
jgi:hypothetical protein